MINPSQRIMLDTYAGGEFSHVTTVDEARTQGDTLFVFLFLELSDGEECHDLLTASGRVNTAVTNLRSVLRALNAAYDKGV